MNFAVGPQAPRTTYATRKRVAVIGQTRRGITIMQVEDGFLVLPKDGHQGIYFRTYAQAAEYAERLLENVTAQR